MSLLITNHKPTASQTGLAINCTLTFDVENTDTPPDDQSIYQEAMYVSISGSSVKNFNNVSASMVGWTWNWNEITPITKYGFTASHSSSTATFFNYNDTVPVIIKYDITQISGSSWARISGSG